MIRIIFILSLFFLGSMSLAQTLCDPETPTFYVDLTGNPTGVFVSDPPIKRLGNCCGSSFPDRCVQFVITLDPAAAGINFTVQSGAIPPGALFYQVGCGPQTQVGEPICLSGTGPHILTFCKPGNNLNTYGVESIPFPYTTNPDTVVKGCFSPMEVSGVVVDSTIKWTSISPGPIGFLDSYLSCTTGCKTVTFTPDSNAPAFIDYQVCGTPVAPCLSTSQFCDTVRMVVLEPLDVASNSVTYCSSDGGVTLNATTSGGLAPYTISWHNAANAGGTQIANSSSVYVTSPGTYSFKATDNSYGLCPIEKIVNVVVTEKLPPIVNAGVNPSVCPDNPVIPLSGSILNGTTVQWIGGAGTFNPSRTDLNATYTMTNAEVLSGGVSLILFSTGDTVCPNDSDTVDLVITSPLTTSIVGPNVICYASRTNLTTNTSGGTPPYAYQWNTGETTASVSLKPPGTYIVGVTDNSISPCVVYDTIIITEDPQLNVIVPDATIVCDTTIVLNTIVTGGRPNYTYIWNTSATTDSLVAYTGDYEVTVTDSLGCIAKDSVTVVASNSTFEVDVVAPIAVCIGQSAFLSYQSTGNVGSTSAVWSTSATTDSIYVAPGSYCVTATDAVGCVGTACNSFFVDSVLFDVTPANVTCNGASNGSGSVVVTSGIPNYTYQWSGNGNTDVTSSSAGLSAGTYNVEVTDSIGCSLQKSIVITQPTLLQVNISKIPISCFGVCDGIATANIIGGTPPYTVSWPTLGSSATTVTGLCAQTYSLIVTDANGCTKLASVNFVQPTQLAATFSVISSNCDKSDGSISALVTGGASPYTYSWSPGGTTNATITNIPEGNYCVGVTDSKGCYKSFCQSIVDAAGVTSSIASSTSVTCIDNCDGTVTSFSSGGSAPYTYSWSNGDNTASVSGLCTGIYTLLTVDNNGCVDTANAYVNAPDEVIVSYTIDSNVCANGGNAIAYGSFGNGGPFTFLWTPNNITSDTALVLPANSPYYVRAYDKDGCESDSIPVTVNPYPVITSSVTLLPNDTICPGESVNLSVSVSGGKSPYTYLWTPSSITTNTATIYPTSSGYIKVQITDNCGTIKLDSVYVFVRSKPFMNPISDSYAGCATHCVNLSNGNTLYPICYWEFDDGNTSNSCTPSHCYTLPGTYWPRLTIIDGNNCAHTDTIDMPIVVYPAFNSVTTPTNPICNGDCNGKITVSSSGGLAPYTYTWNNATTDTIIQNLCPNTYIVYSRDAAGCRDTVTNTLVNPSIVVAGYVAPDNVCDSGGTVYGSGSGGNGAPYTYLWKPNNVVSDSIKVFPANSPYYVRAYDNKGCVSDSIPVIIAPYSPISSAVTLSPNDSVCPNTPVVLSVAANGGNPAYTYVWSPGGSTDFSTSFIPQNSGYVTVSISDNCGTIKRDSVYIYLRPLPIAQPISNLYNGCPTLCVNLSNNVAQNVSCFWDFGDGDTSNVCNPSHCYDTPGTYNPSLAVTDVYGCVNTSTTSIGIQVYAPSPASFTTSPSQLEAYIHNDIKFYDNSPNSVFNQWIFQNDSLDTIYTRYNDPILIYQFEEGNTYYVTLITTDANGCKDTTRRPFAVKDLNYIYVPNTFTPNGNGDNEVFKPSIIGDYNFDTYQFLIFNRWGQLIYRSNNYEEGWDGRHKGQMAKEDSYVWKVEIRRLSEDLKDEFIGHVNLLK